MNARSLQLPAAAATAFALLVAWPAPSSSAPSPSPSPAASASANPMSVMNVPGPNGYQLETDLLNWNMNSGDFTMPHEVKVTRPGTDGRSDRGKGNSKLGTATLIGNVVVHDNGSAPEAKEAGSDYQGPSTITCDQLTVDSKNKSYDAQGNVHFTQGNRTATAERGVLNEQAHTLHLEGNVVLSEGADSMKASVVDYNLQTRNVIASGAPMIIKEPIPQGSPGPTPSPKPSKKKRR